MVNNNIDKNFLVVGVGGLGCYIVEGLLRLNVKGIKVCDPDSFEESNLNRQLYSTPNNLGRKKVEVALDRAKELGYKGQFISIPKTFQIDFLEDIDIVIDALDNIESRLILEDACNKRNIPLVHGAVDDRIYQVGVSLPNSNLLHRIYKDVKEPKHKETNVITVQACASKELSLAIYDLTDQFNMYEI